MQISKFDGLRSYNGDDWRDLEEQKYDWVITQRNED
jgi:hypothetical protein